MDSLSAAAKGPEEMTNIPLEATTEISFTLKEIIAIAGIVLAVGAAWVAMNVKVASIRKDVQVNTKQVTALDESINNGLKERVQVIWTLLKILHPKEFKQAESSPVDDG